VSKLFDFIPTDLLKEKLFSDHNLKYLIIIICLISIFPIIYLSKKAYAAYLLSTEEAASDPNFKNLTLQEKIAKFARNLFKGSQAQNIISSNNDLAHKIYNKMLVQLSKKNISKDPTETPSQFVNKINSAEAQTKVEEITLAYERSHYGQEPNNDPALQESLQELVKRLKDINP
ncbi:DUF4129 domain-containing protein, partial [bacterium]|nr:DUF4129 domain-containing protein [bacterium]